MQGFAAADLAPVFAALDASGWDAILVGGQAVNVWACRYERLARDWTSCKLYRWTICATLPDSPYSSSSAGRS